MFCKNCGKPTEGDSVLCGDCQPDFQVAVPAEGKKKGGKKPILMVLALVLVAGIVLAALNLDSIGRFFVRNFGEPAEYLAEVEKDGAADVAKDLASVYDKALAQYSPEGSSVDTAITVEMSDMLTTMLATALSQSGVELELDWVESITLAPQVDLYENTLRADFGLGINGTDLATLSVIWDMESQTVYMGVPELHKTYLEMDARDVFGSDAQEMAETMAASRQLTEAMMEHLPSGAELEKLVNRYVGLVLDRLEDVEKETETVRAGGLEQKMTVLTVELSQKDVLKIAKAVLKEARDDKDLKSLLEDLGQMAGELNGYETDLYGHFSQGVEEALEGMNDLIDEAEGGDFITVETFLDSSDTVQGRTVTVDNGYEETEIYYITVTEGGKFAFKAEAGTVRIDGKGTLEKGKRSGSYTLQESGTDYVTLELEDYVQADDGTVSGTFRIVPADALYEMMDLPAYLSSMVGAVALELEGDSVRLAIESDGKALLALTMSGQTAKPSPIQIPEGLDVNDDTAAMEWLSELDLDGVLANLKKAGVPESYSNLIGQLLPQIG